jgi:lipoprotein
MKKIVLASVISLSLLFTGCAKISLMRASVQIKSAQKYLLSEDYERAIERLNKAIAMDPMNVEAYLLLVEAYQKSDMNKEAEEVLEKLHDFDELTKEQKEKLEALNSRKVYKDILMNFYRTGVIGEEDTVYLYKEVNDYNSIDDDPLYSYYMKLMDITGDNKDEILVYQRRKDGDSDGVLWVFEVIDDKAVTLCLKLCDYNSSFILNNNTILFNYNKNYAESDEVYSYDSLVSRFEQLNKDDDKVNTAMNMAESNKIKLSMPDIDTLLNPDNIETSVNKMDVSNIVYNDKKKHSSTSKEYKEVYREFLINYNAKGDIPVKFKLLDITGDGKDELIIKDYKDGVDDYCIYEAIDGKAYEIFDEYGNVFEVYNDNTILVESFYDGETSPVFACFMYDKDISRFYRNKNGGYRNGDQECLIDMLNKKAKLTGSEITTELTPSNVYDALE